MVILGFRLCLDNPALSKITAVAADPSAASYTTPRDTTLGVPAQVWRSQRGREAPVLDDKAVPRPEDGEEHVALVAGTMPVMDHHERPVLQTRTTSGRPAARPACSRKPPGPAATVGSCWTDPCGLTCRVATSRSPDDKPRSSPIALSALSEVILVSCDHLDLTPLRRETNHTTIDAWNGATGRGRLLRAGIDERP